MRRLPTRQVHLDFHTSEFMENVGGQFDKKQFQAALQEGHINSITVFGKCHHGYHYFPTRVGTIHPGLAPGRDLAGEMMDACHEIGVYAPLYLTLGWSALDAEQHPEWIARAKDGSCMSSVYDFDAPPDAPRPFCSWIHLCSAGGYRDYLYAMTKEVCERYNRLDGVFFDIVFCYDACYCPECIKGMRRAGLDPRSEADAKAYYRAQKKITLDGLRSIILESHPDATIFFNSGGAEIDRPEWHYASTHFEMEDLPTAWGGYDKMPMRARYFAGLGKDYLGMTGKFHRSWGEFGGYKTPEALKFECAAMLANGARISVGDQLPPSGRMDMATYRNIGKAFSYVESIENYCFDTRETAKLGIMVSTDSKRNEDIAKLILDCQIDFDVVHSGDELKNFDTVILPDNYRLSESLGRAFDEYLQAGGKVLMLGGSGLKENEDAFAFDTGLTYLGQSDSDVDYFQLAEDTDEDIVASPILCYTSGHMVRGEGTVLAHVKQPYFNRTYGKYCSHCNTPYREECAAYPAAILRGNVLYAAHPLAELYADYGVTYHRRYFKWLLRKLYRADAVSAALPSQGRLHFVKREQHRQYVLHLMYASPVQRGCTSVLEDFPTLRDVEISLRIPEQPQEIRLMPQNTTLPFRTEGDACRLTVPEVTCHQMIVISY